MTTVPDHKPEPAVRLSRAPIGAEGELALACAKANADAFRAAGYEVHSVEVMVHQTPKRALAYGHAIGKS
jgi:hypothetical protein